MKFRFLFFPFIAFFLCNVVFAQKKVINEEAYAKWRRVDNYSISPDGRFVVYKYTYLENDSLNKKVSNIYYLFDYNTKKTRMMENISEPNFGINGDWMMYEHTETNGEVEVAKTMLMRMKDGKLVEWGREDKPRFDSDNRQFVTYTVNKGKDYVMYNLNTQDTMVFVNAQRVNTFDNGTSMIYISEGKNSTDMYCGKVAKNAKHTLLFSDKSKTLNGYNFDERKRVGYFEVAEKVGDKDNVNLIYNFDIKTGKVELVLDKNKITVDEPLYVDKSSFSRHAGKKYITFNVYPSKPKSRVKDSRKKDDSFELELWSWNDSISQGIQAVSGYRESRYNPDVYVFNTQSGEYYPVVKGSYSSIFYSNDSNCDYAFLTDEMPYSRFSDWEHDTRFDVYLIDLRNGERKLLKERTTFRPVWTKNGDYIVYYDSQAECWVSLEPKSFTFNDISKSIGHPVANAAYDKPNPRPSYGMLGSTTDGKHVLLEDRYDIWVVDVSGKTPAWSYTRGYGRKNNYSMNFVNPSYSDVVVDLSKDCDLEICDIATMNTSVATISTSGKITKHVTGDYFYEVMKNSDDNSVYLYQMQNFSSDRDLWISDSKFKKPYKVTDANPQQKEYIWGSCEIVEWTNYDGKSNRGLLFLPEDYQKGKSYPAIVNFYETHTGERHIYHAPTYSSAMLDVTTYVSNGYIVFMPDVKFTIGEPGKSSYNSVVSGTKALIERGILDENRIGLQGHSWSGYQTSYLITKTDMFKCVNVGAPIVNMTSAYNGVREGSGMPRMFMYEDWQCRMGATMWDALDKYIESSPILYADKIKTPTLIFHCDKDEAVSFPEGRSLFLALRRLQKPAWLLNYKGEGHFVNKRAAQADWTRRMQQFFDYYLNNTGMPRWMAEGININERGYDQKFNLIEK